MLDIHGMTRSDYATFWQDTTQWTEATIIGKDLSKYLMALWYAKSERDDIFIDDATDDIKNKLFNPFYTDDTIKEILDDLVPSNLNEYLLTEQQVIDLGLEETIPNDFSVVYSAIISSIYLKTDITESNWDSNYKFFFELQEVEEIDIIGKTVAVVIESYYNAWNKLYRKKSKGSGARYGSYGWLDRNTGGSIWTSIWYNSNGFPSIRRSSSWFEYFHNYECTIRGINDFGDVSYLVSEGIRKHFDDVDYGSTTLQRNNNNKTLSYDYRYPVDKYIANGTTESYYFIGTTGGNKIVFADDSTKKQDWFMPIDMRNIFDFYVDVESE